MTHTLQAIASMAGVSLDYALGLLRLNVIDPPDVGREYSPDSARRVVGQLRARKQRLIATMNNADPTPDYPAFRWRKRR